MSKKVRAGMCVCVCAYGRLHYIVCLCFVLVGFCWLRNVNCNGLADALAHYLQHEPQVAPTPPGVAIHPGRQQRSNRKRKECGS